MNECGRCGGSGWLDDYQPRTYHTEALIPKGCESFVTACSDPMHSESCRVVSGKVEHICLSPTVVTDFEVCPDRSHDQQVAPYAFPISDILQEHIDQTPPHTVHTIPCRIRLEGSTEPVVKPCSVCRRDFVPLKNRKPVRSMAEREAEARRDIARETQSEDDLFNPKLPPKGIAKRRWDT